MTKGRRVLMLLENNPYPQDGRVRKEASTLVHAGYHVTVVCPASKGQKKREIVDKVVVFRYPPLEMGDGIFAYFLEYCVAMVAIFLKAMHVFMSYGFDFVHLHNPPDTLALISIPFKLVGRICIYDHHDLAGELYYFGRTNRAKRRTVYEILLYLENLSCRIADHVIVTNESYKTLAIERAGLKDDKVTVVRNGPLKSRFARPPVVENKQKSRVTVGYAGAIGWQDGVDHLIRALHYLVIDRGRTDLCCIVAGGGPALPAVRNLSQSLGLDEFVHFIGPLSPEDVVDVIDNASICVAPEPSNVYNDRSTMIKIMEYMALGKPIVAFDLPEHRVSAGAAALYAVPNDDADLARKIDQLMGDSQLRRTLGDNGRRRIADKLSWECQEKQLLWAYEKAHQIHRYSNS